MAPETEDQHAAWQAWVDSACRAVGVDPSDVPTDDILDLAAVVARGVARPMAPVTAYIAGVAVGSGRSPREVFVALRETVRTSSAPPDGRSATR